MNNGNGTEKNRVFLDPEVDKSEIEKHIIARIEQLLPHADHEEVARAVEVEYEELLLAAKVKIHIPTLVEKLAKEDVRYHIPPGHRQG